MAEAKKMTGMIGASKEVCFWVESKRAGLAKKASRTRGEEQILLESYVPKTNALSLE